MRLDDEYCSDAEDIKGRRYWSPPSVDNLKGLRDIDEANKPTHPQFNQDKGELSNYFYSRLSLYFWQHVDNIKGDIEEANKPYTLDRNGKKDEISTL